MPLSYYMFAPRIDTHARPLVILRIAGYVVDCVLVVRFDFSCGALVILRITRYVVVCVLVVRFDFSCGALAMLRNARYVIKLLYLRCDPIICAGVLIAVVYAFCRTISEKLLFGTARLKY